MRIFNLFKCNKNESNLDRLVKDVNKIENGYSKIQKRFMYYYTSHNGVICVQKNRNSGFTYIMQEIANAERCDGKKVLYIGVGSMYTPKMFKEINLSGGRIDFKTKRCLNEIDFIGKRYDLIIIDEAGFLDDFKKVLNMGICSDDVKIIICSTPVTNNNKNYKTLKKLFEDSEISNSLFRFKKLRSSDKISEMICSLPIESVTCEIYGEFPEYENE